MVDAVGGPEGIELLPILLAGRVVVLRECYDGAVFGVFIHSDYLQY